VVSRQDVDNIRQGCDDAVMHHMSEDSQRTIQTHGMNRTLWRNLGLFPSLSLDCAKWDNIRLTHY